MVFDNFLNLKNTHAQILPSCILVKQYQVYRAGFYHAACSEIHLHVKIYTIAFRFCVCWAYAAHVVASYFFGMHICHKAKLTDVWLASQLKQSMLCDNLFWIVIWKWASMNRECLFLKDNKGLWVYKHWATISHRTTCLSTFGFWLIKPV